MILNKLNLKRFLTIVMSLTAFVAFAQNATIRGTVIDESGEPVPFAAVVVGNNEYFSQTDLDGAFSVDVPAGKYTILIESFPMKATLEGVVALAGKVKVLDVITLKSETQVVDVVQIQVTKSVKTESALLNSKKKAVEVKDGISKAEVKRAGDGNVAQTVKRIPGISIVGGKYVFVRGIGDRYNKTTLNGMDIPGLDPDRNAIQMDIFPTSIIDNIIVSKSFSGPQPADFAGGVIDIGLKDFPDRKEGSFSISASYNPGMHFNSNYLKYDGGSYDFLGMDDGKRARPTTLFVSRDQVISSPSKAPLYNSFVNSFSTQMAGYESLSLMDYSLSGGYGDQINLKNSKGAIGYNFALSYSNKTRFYSDAEYGDFGMRSDDNSVVDLEVRNRQTGTLATNNVLLSMMGGVAYKKGSDKIKMNVLRIQNGITRSGEFDFQRDDQGNDFIGKRFTLGYNQRELTNFLIEGKHAFGATKDSTGKVIGKPRWELEWKSSPTLSKLSDPDIRSTIYELDEGSGYVINTNSGLPQRLWREMNEITVSNRVDLTRKFKFKEEESKLKFGVASTYKSRDFAIYSYQFEGNQTDLKGDANEVFEDLLWDASTGSGGEGFVVKPDFLPDNTNAYSATTLYNAGYVSTELGFTKKFKSVLGLRVEKFDQRYSGKYNDGGIKQLSDSLVLGDLDIFPGLNFIYALTASDTNSQNLRLSMSKTIARPSMKEKSFANILDPFSGRTFIGAMFSEEDNGVVIWDGNLKSTDIYNFDVRWELFQKLAQTVSFSAFYKKFINPIEIVQYATADNNFQPRNVGDGDLIGGEFDIRQRLTFIQKELVSWAFNLNVTATHSRIKLSSTEFNSKVENAREGQTINEYRDMAGQAPFLVNSGLSYLGSTKEGSFWNGVQTGFFYNVQGRTLQIVGIADKPDIYTNPFHSLNFTFTKKFVKRDEDGSKKYEQSVRLKVTNILNDANESVFDAYGSDKTYYFSRLRPGSSIGLRYGFKF